MEHIKIDSNSASSVSNFKIAFQAKERRTNQRYFKEFKSVFLILIFRRAYAF